MRLAALSSGVLVVACSGADPGPATPLGDAASNESAASDSFRDIDTADAIDADDMGALDTAAPLDATVDEGSGETDSLADAGEADASEDTIGDSIDATTSPTDATADETDATTDVVDAVDATIEADVGPPVAPSTLWYRSGYFNYLRPIRRDLPSGTPTYLDFLVSSREFDITRDGTLMVAVANPRYRNSRDLWAFDGVTVRLLFAAAEDELALGAKLSPDGTKVAFTTSGGAMPGSLRLVSTGVSPTVTTLGAGGSQFHFWSTDSRYVAGHEVYDTTAATPAPISFDPTACSPTIVALAGVSTVVYTSTCGTGANELRTKDLATSSAPKKIASLSGPSAGRSDLSDTGKLAYLDGSAFVVDVFAGTPPVAVPIPAGMTRVGEPRLSPDGSQIAFGADDAAGKSGMYVGKVAGAIAPVELPTTTKIEPTRATWSPDGRSIAFYSRYSGELFRVPDVATPKAVVEATVVAAYDTLLPQLVWTQTPPAPVPVADAGTDAALEVDAEDAAVDSADSAAVAGGTLWALGNWLRYDSQMLFSGSADGPLASVFDETIDVSSFAATSGARVIASAEVEGPYAFGVWLIEGATLARTRLRAGFPGRETHVESVSPDGKYFVDDEVEEFSDYKVQLASASGILRTFTGSAPSAWGSDRYVLREGPQLRIVDATGAAADVIVPLPAGYPSSSLEWFAGSDVVTIAWNSSGTAASLFRLAMDGTLIASTSLPVTSKSTCCVSADGEKLAVFDGSSMTVRKTDGTGTATTVAFAATSLGSCAFSPDGARVAVTNPSGSGLHVWSAGATSFVRITSASVRMFVWAPSSDRVAWVSDGFNETVSRSADVVTPDGEPVVLLSMPRPATTPQLAWTP